MILSDIAKVVYAPHKVFKGIANSPKYLGPIIIIVLFVIGNMAFAYAATSKTYVEQTLPNGLNKDEWTENRTYWTSNAAIAESSDSINGSYYGNASIAFSLTNGTQVWMQLNNIGSVNCSGPDGFNETSLRIKWINPASAPESVNIQLFSVDPSNYFYASLSDNFSASGYNIWNNLTIPLVSGWGSAGSNATWGNITGLRLQFTWPSNANITVLVDGLFFHGIFKSLLETAGNAYIVNYGIAAVMQFAITWVLFSGLLYLVAKGLRGKLVWKSLLILVGFILITLFIQAVINAAAYATLPNVRWPFDLIGGVSGEGQPAFNTLIQQTSLVTEVSRYTQIAIYVWTIGLASLAVHEVAQFAWPKSLITGTVAYLATLVAASFLFGI